jgi:hypothetical protein
MRGPREQLFFCNSPNLANFSLGAILLGPWIIANHSPAYSLVGPSPLAYSSGQIHDYHTWSKVRWEQPDVTSRATSRIVLLDERGRVLLFKFADPNKFASGGPRLFSRSADMAENRSKSARQRAICDRARTERAPLCGRFAQISQFLSGRDLPRSTDLIVALCVAVW